MNIFVLNTGRCGSVTFHKACSHIENYQSGHESRSGCLGKERLLFPDNFIEADNRLAWFLGRLEETYGDNAFYVHLTRDPQQAAQSFVNRYHSGIIRAYRKKIYIGLPKSAPPLDVALDYCHTVNSNIIQFLRDKPRKMHFRLEFAKEDFKLFWQSIGARGNLDAALAEWDRKHNPSATPSWFTRLIKR